MKTIRLALILAAACTWALAEDPVVGNERAEVIKRIGKPTGKMSMGGHETLLYDRGVVELTSGLVTRVKLVTPAQLAEQQAAQEKAAAAAAAAQRERIAAGEKARKALMQSDAYKTNSAAGKVAAWESFRREYPEVEPPAEFKEAVAAKQEVERKEAAAAAAAVAAAKEEPKPRLSSSKKRKMRRYGTEEEAAPPAP